MSIQQDTVWKPTLQQLIFLSKT